MRLTPKICAITSFALVMAAAPIAPASAQSAGAAPADANVCREGSAPNSALFCSASLSTNAAISCDSRAANRDQCVKASADRACQSRNYANAVAYVESGNTAFAELLCFGRQPAVAGSSSTAPTPDQLATQTRVAPPEPNYTGNVYATNDWGDLTITEWSANSFGANFTHENGRIQADRNGMQVDGYWYQSTSAQACETPRNGSVYYGRMSFTFNPDMKAFEGTWGYCDETPYAWWNGTLTRRGN